MQDTVFWGLTCLHNSDNVQDCSLVEVVHFVEIAIMMEGFVKLHVLLNIVVPNILFVVVVPIVVYGIVIDAGVLYGGWVIIVVIQRLANAVLVQQNVTGAVVPARYR